MKATSNFSEPGPAMADPEPEAPAQQPAPAALVR
jgi:hypothetical protein